ncbi:hypothetical protein [Desulfarculus baarsii]
MTTANIEIDNEAAGPGPEDQERLDEEIFRDLVSVELSAEQRARLVAPPAVHPRQRAVLAVHWHPEWIPIELTMARLAASYPNRQNQLIIPTQHNELLCLGELAGVEIDCYSSGFNRKVQLLLHMRAEAVERADVLRSMLSHTFKYRGGQLWEFIDSIVEPAWDARMQEAAAETGANDEVVAFVRDCAARLRALLADHESDVPPMMIKNKLVSEFIAAQRPWRPERMISRALLLAKAVKQIVKREFSLQYFYRASEVIEEARGLGAGVVIPHPEQFWPILLADYDVDGYEVWNPQSREYTEFLIGVLNRQNKSRAHGERRLLVFMGDDTHMSEKAKPPELQDRQKAAREVGLQPAWDDPAIRKALMLAGMDRDRVIDQYRGRLA